MPGDSLPLVPQPANSNLDVISFDGAVFLAFRTAPTHFASADTELHVLRSVDEETWTHELPHFGRISSRASSGSRVS